jgi:antitoxin MazE
MATVVRTRIVRIGNSQGVRIPKLLLEQVDLGEDVELVLQENQIVIRRAFPVRHGWDEAFRGMAEAADDRPVAGDEPLATRWDEEEWEW